ncbi:MAG: biopolymer transporter ExbD [Deltaproteobacteria bacterium]|nr:biopolymer transporter ExbD [Deltaproteobacteria bacterium]
MKFGRGKRRDESVIVDLTAMLDVAFNLILFLMVTTTFAKRNQAEGAQDSPGIQVSLPRSSSQAVLSQDQDINVWMAADGSVFVDDQPVDTAGLRSRLRAAAEANPNTLVIIRADTGVSHGRVVAVMDQARNVGLTKQAIATDPTAQ